MSRDVLCFQRLENVKAFGKVFTSCSLSESTQSRQIVFKMGLSEFTSTLTPVWCRYEYEYFAGRRMLVLLHRTSSSRDMMGFSRVVSSFFFFAHKLSRIEHRLELKFNTEITPLRWYDLRSIFMATDAMLANYEFFTPFKQRLYLVGRNSQKVPRAMARYSPHM
ncbi:hypothetical protein U1Q18_051840 [Sarracenia purpurea var. burkii]